jgi:hypothetical protein
MKHVIAIPELTQRLGVERGQRRSWLAMSVAALHEVGTEAERAGADARYRVHHS